MSNRRFSAVFIATSLAFVLLLASPLSIAVPVAVPGTSVSLQPPAGFVLADAFSGFYRASDNSSITVAELPAEAFPELSKLFASLSAARHGFSTKGITINKQRIVRVAGQPISVLTGSQQAGNINVGKTMALLKGVKTILVTFNVMDSRDLSEVNISNSIQSITLSGTVSVEDKLSRLPFAFEVSSPFRVFDTLGGSGVLLTTFEGTDPTGNQPILIIVRALQPGGRPDLFELSKQLLENTKGFETAKITRSEMVDFGGGQGHLVHVSANGKKALQYLRVPDDGRYLRLFASGSEAALEALLPIINKIAQSVSINE